MSDFPAAGVPLSARQPSQSGRGLLPGLISRDSERQPSTQQSTRTQHEEAAGAGKRNRVRSAARVRDREAGAQSAMRQEQIVSETLLTPSELSALREFFLLLDRWDREERDAAEIM